MNTLARAILLGAGRGVRRLDVTKSYPAALEHVAETGPAMDWILAALRRWGTPAIGFVGGYHIEKMIERYPEVHYFFHPDWQRGAAAAALVRAKSWLGAATLVGRADVVLAAPALERVMNSPGDVVWGAFDDGDPVAVAFIRAEEAPVHLDEITERLAARDPLASLEDWVGALGDSGLDVRRVDVAAHAASVTKPSAVARLLLGTKAQTLDRLRPLVRGATILDQLPFTVEAWRSNPDAILERARTTYGDRAVIVRSSSSAEDQFDATQAGRFASIEEVRADDPEALRDAVGRVIASFATVASVDDKADTSSQVFLQEQLREIRSSGVLMTADLESGAPYFVINLDRHSARANVVTSGSAGRVEKIVVHRAAGERVADPDVRRLVDVAVELEALVFHDALDIEFAFDHSGNLFVLQVRPLGAPPGGRRFRLTADDLAEEIAEIRQFVGERLRPSPLLVGEANLLGIMPDWNPAEMIGTAPRPLALSLYQRLVGDEAWAAARARLGYRDVRPEPLLLALGGRPYVDVRASFNSFLPAKLPRALAARLVDHQLARLRRAPELHDKVEFEVALTCAALDLEDDDPRWSDAPLEGDERALVRRLYVELTDRMILGESAAIADMHALIGELSPRRQAVLRHVKDRPHSLARAISTLVDDTRRFGLEPFSVLARMAFVALGFLRGLARRGVLSSGESEALLGALPTVSGAFRRDLGAHLRGELDRASFLEHYGHLRPSSYDITSPDYAAAPDLYLALGAPEREEAAVEPAAAHLILDGKRAAIDRLLAASGFRARGGELAAFIAQAIPGREQAKFEFMKSTGAVLELVTRLGARVGVDREAMSFLPIDRLARLSTDSPSAAFHTELLRDIEYGKKRWNLTCALQLPPLVGSVDEVESFAVREALPNFVGSKRVVAPIRRLGGEPIRDGLAGHIVLIESADPGYDWIFAHRIAGLVTRHGGVASHMAIRAAEFGLPAAIGCGELLFERVCRARLLELDGATQILRVIQ